MKKSKDQIKERHVQLDTRSLTKISKIDKYVNSKFDELIQSSGKSTKKEFLDSLELHCKPGKDLYTYRAIKTGLIETRMNAKNLHSKFNMTYKEFVEAINSTIKKLDEQVLDLRDEFYQSALDLLEDEAGFEELEKLREKYLESLTSHYLIKALENQNKLESHKMDLLSIIRGDSNENR